MRPLIMFRQCRRHFSMATATDHYKVLGVSPAQKTSEIKLAYYKLAKQYHPDTTSLPSAQAIKKFAAIGKAWEVLSNELTRQKYDMERTSFSQSSSDPFMGGFKPSQAKPGSWTFTSKQFEWSDDDASDVEEWFSGLGFSASNLRDAFFGGKPKRKQHFRPLNKPKQHKPSQFKVKIDKHCTNGHFSWGFNPDKYNPRAKSYSAKFKAHMGKKFKRKRR